MKKHWILPRLLLLSSTLANCQGSIQQGNWLSGQQERIVSKQLPPELILETVQNVNGLAYLRKLMRTSVALNLFAREKYTKGQAHYALVRYYEQTYGNQDMIADWPNDIQHVKAAVDVLVHNKTIKYITLARHAIGGDAGAKMLAQALEKNKAIKYIDLSNNAITDAGAKVLAQALEKNKAIKYIDLSSNAITDAGAKVLAQALEKNKAIGRTINLDHNNISNPAFANQLVQPGSCTIS